MASGQPVGELGNILYGNLKIWTGIYTGTGVDEREVGLAGFRPIWGFLKRSGGYYCYMRSWKMGTYKPAINALATNEIIRTHGSGYTLGTNADVNTNNVSGFMVVFGIEPKPTTSGTLAVIGGYIGDGTSRAIVLPTAFIPKFVMVWRSGGYTAVFATDKHPYYRTSYFDNTADIMSGSIDGLGVPADNNFLVGPHVTSNISGYRYHYLAVGVGSGNQSGGAAKACAVDLVASYSLSDEMFIPLPFTPHYAHAINDAYSPCFGTSGEVSIGNAHYYATTMLADGFKKFEPGGMWVGQGTGVQTSSRRHEFFAISASGL